MKAYTDPIARQKMASAFLYMSKVKNDHTKKRYTSKLYEYHKKIRAEILSEQMSGEGNHMFGRKHSEETKKKISKARLGVSLLPEHEKIKRRDRWLINNPNYDPVATQKRIDAKSKLYDITFPDGTQERIKNLNKFCKERSLNPSNLLVYGHSKGYKCMKVV